MSSPQKKTTQCTFNHVISFSIPLWSLMNNVRFHFAGAQVCDIQATANVCQSHSSPSSLRWSGGGAGGK